ncbi:MAG: tetratricopeptide repeat protein [Campylobacterales bacterium]
MDIRPETFDEEVINASYNELVVVDFWAPWCGPCRMLGPILEKVCDEFGVKLAKVNTETYPELASRFQVRGIPDVRFFKDGKVIDSFTGALPESQVRTILSKYAKSNITRAIEEAKALALREEIDKAKKAFEKLVASYPQNAEVLIAAADFALEMQDEAWAKELLGRVSRVDPLYSQAQARLDILAFKEGCQEEGSSEVARLYQQGCCHALKREWREALEAFVQAVAKDRSYKDDAARKAMLSIFARLGDRDPLTVEYRRRLSSVLF